ncbi:site-specific DNA-methyltransferase [Moraxella canis]|uniref:site-specific DNA-methyltransferase (adenine-specific) n=1 Tax=Moraxella canis TaxID=90239 RepID=A0ABZ0WXX7_9GAMM|nr:site-specific DNA-methyltransferase [Moraxella canis]WQE03890.1 site-specific DNA-methyltransferase [Moraxella canis]
MATFTDLDNEINGTIIHSDNFQALNLLQAKYQGQVKCIYIDPPYNTEDDRAKGKFIYKDGYPSSTWASMIYDRLLASKTLLNQTGIIFQSIDDNEHSELKLISDKIFGFKNYLSSFIRKTKSMTGDDNNGLNIQHEYLISYAVNKSCLKISGEEKTLEGYSNPDNDPNGDWCSGDPSAKSGGSSTYFPIKNPYTGLEDYPPQGRYWAFSQETMQEYIRNGRIKFKEKYSPKNRGFIFKRYANNLTSNFMPVGTIFSVDNDYMNSVATTENKNIFSGSMDFDYPKPKIFVQKLIQYSTEKTDLILDYFAGSGTTAHAVINLNREDGGNRKFILVEQGEYFDTVLKPRIQKVIFAKDYKDGKPVADKDGQFGGISQMVKVLKLESYEDTLNNLVLHQSDLLGNLPQNAQNDYLLNYMLDIESRESLLNVADFAHPFDYELNISANSAGAFVRQKIDLVETFNYLIGATVLGIDDRRDSKGYVEIECRLPRQNDDERTLIFWRDCDKLGYDELKTMFVVRNINPKESIYQEIYINGDHTLDTVWESADGVQSTLKVKSIEQEFLTLMFGAI